MIEIFDSWRIGVVDYEFIEGVCTYLKSTYNYNKNGRYLKRDFYIDCRNSIEIVYIYNKRILK